jgi:phosphorylase kinase alpha/beta subunit
MWEEDEEVHASSVGACLAGLKAVSLIKGIEVPPHIIIEGEKSLNYLLPRESSKKFVDLAQLSLIWPYNVVSNKQAKEILKNVSYLLERKHGIVRYKNDHYYNKNPDGYSEEAEWCFGFSWLAIIYEKLGDRKTAQEYIQKAMSTINSKGEIPELYYSNSRRSGPNTPLGWSESLFIVSLHEINDRHKEFFHIMDFNVQGQSAAQSG